MERAIVDIDDGFAASYDVRRRHREVLSHLFLMSCRYLKQETQQHRNGQPFWDPSATPSGFSANLPDPLRVKPTGLQPHQVGVYEDFGEFLYWVIAT